MDAKIKNNGNRYIPGVRIQGALQAELIPVEHSSAADHGMRFERRGRSK